MKEGYLESRGDVSVARIYSSRKVILSKLVKFLWSIRVLIRYSNDLPQFFCRLSTEQAEEAIRSYREHLKSRAQKRTNIT